MRKLFLCFFLTLGLTQLASSQKIAPVIPETSGFSSERLKRIDASMNEWVSKGWMNGAVGMVIHNGKIVYYKSIGYDDPDTRKPLPKDGIFRIASQTKAITSVAIMMLYEEGKLLLDDPVSKFIPTFAHQTVLDKFNSTDSSYSTKPLKRDITIRDLLTHTSGIGYAQIGSKEANSIYAKNKITAGLYVTHDKLSDAMTRLGTLPLMHQPGERWTYGLNMDLLGYLVELRSGMTLDEFFRKRIFEPLGMTDTYFNVPKEKANRLVNFFQEDSLGHLRQESRGLDMNYPLMTKTYFSGGGGLSSSIYDYGVFLQMLLNGGKYNGVRILSHNSIRMMTVNQIGDLNLGENKFGLGFSLVTDKSSRLSPPQSGTYSWGGAFSTTYWVDPAEKMVVLMYRQMRGSHGGEIDDTFKVLVYQAMDY